MERFICVIIGYAFGLLQTGYLYGKLHHVDIRKPVSYTHLDVYKRQIMCLEWCASGRICSTESVTRRRF